MNCRVKICGITCPEDARVAVDAGAAAVGFIFSRTSRRYVHPDVVRKIVSTLPPFVTPVGVTVNEPRENIRRLIAGTGIRAIQFHGHESPADLGGYDIPVYKAFRVGKDFDAAVIPQYPGNVCLLDGFAEGMYGGTGQTVDFTIARQVARSGRLILSGGLNPGNIGKAILAVAPYAVDVNSGVEREPGTKDPEKIRALFEAIALVREEQWLHSLPSA